MNLLQYLTKALGSVQSTQQIPVGQQIPQQRMQSYSPEIRAMAQIYNQNPEDPRVAGIDPAIFGYAPDETVAPPQLRAMQGRGIQPFGPSYEDVLSPLDALTQRSYNNGQVTKNGDFMQPINNDFGVQTSLHGGLMQGGGVDGRKPNAQKLRVVNQIYKGLFR